MKSHIMRVNIRKLILDISRSCYSLMNSKNCFHIYIFPFLVCYLIIQSVCHDISWLGPYLKLVFVWFYWLYNLCNLFPNFCLRVVFVFTYLKHVRCLCQIVLYGLHGVPSQCQGFSAGKVFETPIAALFSEAGDPFVNNFHDLCLCQSQQGFRWPMTIYCIHGVFSKLIPTFPTRLWALLLFESF